MCQENDGFSHVRIVRCEHGTNFMTLGNITLTLSDAELVLIDRAILKLAKQSPSVRQELSWGICANTAVYRNGDL